MELISMYSLTRSKVDRIHIKFENRVTVSGTPFTYISIMAAFGDQKLYYLNNNQFHDIEDIQRFRVEFRNNGRIISTISFNTQTNILWELPSVIKCYDGQSYVNMYEDTGDQTVQITQ